MNEYDPIEYAESSPEAAKELRLWATLLHLSLLAGLIIPFGGLVVPVVIYLVKKDDVPGLQPHWHVVINWLLSALIYAVISIILMLVLIGFLLIWALGLLALIFPIIGAIKANDGEVWPYPLSIRFFGRD
ncbi:MAG: DUF4870 domain-containing protein [Wenzhouxiangellaceae bacterium]|jgi:uncharacterized Tic20 family protein|nr:DUF4870 domain-containing protein [Wenzhouxiangellaceae bacterium]MBS3746636.1 DUF4870 domain-containing protein [Wenzhouxiangellaceae bacterium]MBS3823450.1 DUF4870 domain-containing protein [Wenzhouxiangellaceae bacterium]